MNKMLFISLAIFFSVVSQAKKIQSEQLNLSPSSIDKTIRLVDKNEPGSSHKKLSIIVTDNGMSTDVSPRYQIYLGYASLAEMGNITVDFKISEDAYQFVSASRKSAGIYEVKTVEYRGDGFYDVTLTIDATKVFSDERSLRQSCGDDFCDQMLKSTIKVTETSQKQP